MVVEFVLGNSEMKRVCSDFFGLKIQDFCKNNELFHPKQKSMRTFSPPKNCSLEITMKFKRMIIFMICVIHDVNI